VNTTAPTPAEPILELREADIASARAEAETVLTGVNWQVHAGDFWVAGGLPGGGKSALLLTAAGVQPPAKGQLLLFGQVPKGLTEMELIRLRNRVSLLLESGGRLFSHLSVAENIALPWQYHQNVTFEASREKVLPLLEWLELGHFANAAPTTVPRSHRPRIALARALITGPEILLLDNPLRGLDVRQSHWWLDRLAELAGGHSLFAGHKMTLLVATEDFRPWLNLGKQFGLVGESTWALLGDAESVRQHKSLKVHELLAKRSEFL
jgi:putative ABC transport system ATP-binding protein